MSATTVTHWTDSIIYPKDDGIFVGVSEETYHANRQRMSKHQLDDINRSPAHYREARKNPKDPTASKRWGSLLDMLVTQPVLFLDRYAEGPDVAKNTKAWKAFEAVLPEGREGIKASTWASLFAARDSLLAHETAGPLFEAKDKLCGITINWSWRDGDVYVPMRSRPDLWVPERQLLVDLKTTEDAQENAFARTCAKYRYHVQAACYLTAMRYLGFPGLDFWFAAVESIPPYAVAVWIPDEEDLELGFEQMRDNLSLFYACKQRDEWPAYSPMAQTLKLPGYYRAQNQRKFL